jgi:beta-1,2-mannobiose phosphorylase / 1,2-beta-oligomannan phosphorylase
MLLGYVTPLPTLTRLPRNPIIFPRRGRKWEEGGTFNPGAIGVGSTVHVLYRAVDRGKVSRLGYVRTSNSARISFRSSKPVLEPSADWEEYGCEDPRITALEGTFYVTYTAFSKRGPRIALASTKDFSHFEKHGLVGPDRNDKDWVLFPARINGKIAMLHRLRSKVQIAYFESVEELENSQKFWIEYVKHFRDYEVIGPKFSWEKRKVGVGPPPIRTEQGWLVIYHGVSAERIYRAGAVLLDLDDPTKILARTKEPILEPKMKFEKRGVVPNVVFPDGAVILDGKLLVYYGGADKVCCVASAPVDEFLDKLERRT